VIRIHSVGRRERAVHDGIQRCDNQEIPAGCDEGRLRFRTLEELAESLADAAFTVERVYGDWDRRPVGPTTRGPIVVAAR
jgi:hypothetical protein